MRHAIVNGLLQQGYTLAEATPQSPHMYIDTWNTGWDRHDIGGRDQYTKWNEFVIGRDA